MMIGISTQIYDPAGARIFPLDPVGNRSGARRSTRTATLDGGVAVYDTGYSDGDRTCNIKEPGASKEAVDFARYIVENYDLITISMPDGAYSGVPESYRADDGTLLITVLLTEKLSD